MTKRVFFWLLGAIGAAIIAVIVTSVIVSWRARQGKSLPGFTDAETLAAMREVQQLNQSGGYSPAIYPTADTQSIYVSKRG